MPSPVYSQSIRASVLHGVNDLRIENRSLPPPGPDEVQVAIRATGLCGSDLHYFRHYCIGDIRVQEPMSLGHESAGVVVAVGDAVSSGLAVGDKVALEVGQPCSTCELCVQGRYNLCRKMRFRSSAKSFPHAQGTLQDRINHPAAWCHKLPEDMPLALGALLEPLSVAIHATRRSGLAAGATTLVFGAGAVGLLVAAMCKISGAETVVIVDIDQSRTDFAVSNGFADHAVVTPPKSTKSIDEALENAKAVAANIAELKKSSGNLVGEVDITFECTGVPSCVQSSIYATKPGGKVMLIGMGTPVQTLPISAAALREVDICGVFRYANTYPTGIELLSSRQPGHPDILKLVTHRYAGLDSVEDAFAMASKTKDDKGQLVLKVLVEMGSDV